MNNMQHLKLTNEQRYFEQFSGEEVMYVYPPNYFRDYQEDSTISFLSAAMKAAASGPILYRTDNGLTVPMYPASDQQDGD